MNKLRFLVILFVLTMGCGGIFVKVKKPIIIATIKVEEISIVETIKISEISTIKVTGTDIK